MKPGDGSESRSADSGTTTFVVLAFAFSWAALLPLALRGPGASSDTLGALLHLGGAVGPALAAFVVTGRYRTRHAWVRRLRRLPGDGMAWALALVIPLGLFVASFLLLPGEAPSPPGPAGDPLAWAIAIAVGYGLLEEAGWRGYLLPHLQARFGALAASAIIAGLHAVWHAPMFAYREQLALEVVPGFAVSLLAASIVFTHLFNRSGGSVAVVALFHVTWNLTILVGSSVLQGVATAMSVGLIVVAVVLLARYGGRTLSAGPAVR